MTLALPSKHSKLAAGMLVVLALSRSATSAATGKIVEIPLDMVGGRPQVAVLINGEGPYPFVLDTGSSLDVVDSGIARELGLEVVGETEIGAPGMPRVAAQIVRGRSLEVHGVELSAGEFVTADLAAMSGGLFLGVLRFSSFADSSSADSSFADSLATLDLAAGILRISPGALDPESPGVLAFDSPEGLIDLPISIGGLAVTAHLDTGSPGAITVPTKLAQELAFLEAPVAIGQARLVGGGGTVSRARLQGVITVGHLRFEDPEVTILDLPVPKVNLGSGFLSDYVVQVDQRHRLIHFEAPQRKRLVMAGGPGGPGASGAGGGRKLGLRPVPGPPGANGLALRDSGLPVDWVEPDGLASLAGLVPGDLILSVNGTSLPDLSAASLIALFKGSEALRMEVRRADGSVDVVEIP